MTVANPSNYWISGNALRITLNANGDADYIQGNTASGAMILCFIKDVTGLGYDAGHNYQRWKLLLSPTYFATKSAKYVYVAIPRAGKKVPQDFAQVVFPSEKLDIYGKNASEQQIGSTDYYYIWLQGIISASEVGGVLQDRVWTEQIQTGTLASDEAYEAGGDNTWWKYSSVSDTVTFLKTIAHAVFERMRITTRLIFGNSDESENYVSGIANNDTSDTSEHDIVTPAYGKEKYLSRKNDDTAQGWITVLAGVRTLKDFIESSKGGALYTDEDALAHLTTDVARIRERIQGSLRIGDTAATETEPTLHVGGNTLVDNDIQVGGDLDVTGRERIDRIQSHNYSGSGLADTGYMITSDDGTGSSMAVLDYLTIRKKMIVNSIEVKETHFSAGDIAHTLASCEIARTDYLYVDENGGEELLGYSRIKVPWLLRGAALVLGVDNGIVRGLYSRYKRMRLTLTEEQLRRCNRIRCYFLSKDGDREIENWFRPNDLVRCQTWNVVRERRETFTPDFNDHAGNVYYWRKIHDVSWNTGETRYVARDSERQPTDDMTTDVSRAYVNEGGVARLADNGIHSNSVDGAHAQKEIDGNTYHWFDVDYDYAAEQAGGTGSADKGSDIPAAGDKVVQFGNTTDPDRMNIYLIEVNGAGNPDAPDWKMYRGVYTFNLSQCWWGGESCMKTKWSVSTGIEAYAPSFKWITEYGRARQVITREEGFWSSIALERDDWSNYRQLSDYPDYSDDILDSSGNFVSRVNGKPKNWVRKCRYYDQVAHNGSAWLCSRAESFYWRDKDGNMVSSRVEGAEYVRDYTTQEPSAAAGDWTEQVGKGDPGAFKSQVFCRSNSTPSSPSNEKRNGYNTYDNPVPPAVSGQPTWTDGAPGGAEILWMSTAWFYSDGKHSDWTTPRQQTDTETLDVEFSPNATQPSTPAGTAADKDTSSVKAQRHAQGWYDPNDTLPTPWTWSDMVWRAERRIKNGVYYGNWSVSRIKGENSVRIDLSNENDTMLYSSSKGLVSGSVQSTAYIFDGSDDVSDGESTIWKVSASGCTLTSGNSRNIVVTDMTEMTAKVTVTATYTDRNKVMYTRSTQLTLKKIIDGDKYDLDITPSSIAYNVSKDSPATSDLTIRVWRTAVDGTHTLSEPPSGYYVYAGGTRLTASSTGIYSITTDNSAVSGLQVMIAKSADGTDTLDSETIPVVKAEDGTSPYFADIDNEMHSVACDKNGSTLEDFDLTVGVSLWHGSTPIALTTLTTDTPEGFTITANKSAKTIRIQVAKGTAIAEVNDIRITVAGSGSGEHSLHFTLNGVRQGENGEPAVLYALVPSVSAVVRKKDGTYSVDNVSCTRQKNVGGVITENATDGEIKYRLDGGNEKSYTNNTGIAVSNFSKSIQFIYRVGGKTVDIETILMVADGEDGKTPTISIGTNGHWIINGTDTGVTAEGKDGTGVAIKGTVATTAKMTIENGKGYATPMNSDGSDAPEVEVKHGDCYICNSDRHLYMFTNTPAVAWNDLGEFQGKPGEDGKSSYMHIAYAKKNPLNVSTSTVDTIGFTVNSDGSQYEWMGFCTDDKESDPGRNWSSLSPSQKVAAVNAYKWNYMKGKDGSGYEYIYLLTKEGFKPTIDESSGQGSQSDDEFYPSVGNYQDGKIYGNSRYWNDDPPADISETWPVLWWASRKKSDGVWQAFGSVDLHNRYAKDGTSPWIADLDNEMDSVACDNDGKPVVQQAVSTNVSLFYGSQKKAFITSVNSGDTGITISFSNKTSATAKDSDTVTITFATNAVISGKKEFEITLTAKDDASIQRVLTLTVNGLKGGATYNLVPSDSFVLLNKAKQYVPSVLTCTYNKFDVAKGQFVTPSGGTVKYIKDGETAENAYKQLVPGTDFTNNVTFLLYVGATLVDRETIHIVKDGTDGLSAQSYIETQEAWSNQETTASADTMPSDCQEGDWKDSTPANTNSRTYLWRRSRKMTLKADKSGYDAGQWAYTRLSGTNGTSIKTQGTVAATSKLLDKEVIPLVNGADGARTAVEDGWAYVCQADRHLYQWSDETRSKSGTWTGWQSGWLDLGEFKGESGKTYYTHVAWARGITIGTPTADRRTGQRTTPNASACEEFSISPQDDLEWMGVLVDEEVQDAAGADGWKYYTWNKVQGIAGENSVRLALDNEHEDFLYDGTTLVAPSAGASSPIRLYDGGNDITASMPAPVIHSVIGTTKDANGAYISNKTLYVKSITASTCEVVVKCTYNETTYYAKFTANKTNQDKYDIVCKPSSIAYNSTTHAAKAGTATIQTVSLSATGIGIGGTSLSPSLSTSVGAGRLCVFWAPVNSNGMTGGFSPSPVTSKAVTKQECESYVGIYFELRYYTSSSNYRICDYETVEIAKTKDGDSIQGDNGVGLVVNPSSLILNEDSDASGQAYIREANNTATIRLYEGGAAQKITVTKQGATNYTWNGNELTGNGTSQVTMTLNVGNIASGDNVRTGSISLRATSEDGNVIDFSVPFYVNRLQTFSRVIDKGVETALGEAHVYEMNPDGTVKDTEYLYKQVNSAKKAITTLQDTVGDASGGLVKQVSTLEQTAKGITSRVSRTEEKVALLSNKEELLDLTGLDSSKAYPVTINLRTGIDYTTEKIMCGVERPLMTSYNAATSPDYYGHNSGFMTILEWTTFQSGWGAIVVPTEWSTSDKKRYIDTFEKYWLSPSTAKVAGSIGQVVQVSTEFVYLRGGSKYRVYTSKSDAEIELHPSGVTLTYNGGSRTLSVINASDIVEPVQDRRTKEQVSSEIRQTADSISLSVRSGIESSLRETGIDIVDKIITMKAEQTIFKDLSGREMISFEMVEYDGSYLPSLVFWDNKGKKGGNKSFVLNWKGLIDMTQHSASMLWGNEVMLGTSNGNRSFANGSKIYAEVLWFNKEERDGVKPSIYSVTKYMYYAGYTVVAGKKTWNPAEAGDYDGKMFDSDATSQLYLPTGTPTAGWYITEITEYKTGTEAWRKTFSFKHYTGGMPDSTFAVCIEALYVYDFHGQIVSAYYQFNEAMTDSSVTTGSDSLGEYMIVPTVN